MVGSCDDKEGEVVAVLVGGAQVIVLAASSSVLTTGWGCATRACFADSKCALRSVMLPLVPPGSPDRHASVPPVAQEVLCVFLPPCVLWSAPLPAGSGDALPNETLLWVKDVVATPDCAPKAVTS